MKITYTPNPLRTIIELDEHEKKEFLYKLKVEELIEHIHEADFQLNEGDQFYNPKRARKDLNIDSLYVQDGETKSKIDQRVDEMCEYYLKALADTHGGDCTCVACSCDKCHAEDILGIRTTAGLRAHEGSKIDGAFWRGKDQPERTLDEVIELLSGKCDYSATEEEWTKKGFCTKEQFETYIPRWQQERANALEWLKNYRDKHFNGENI